jgi:protein SCO1/2
MARTPQAAQVRNPLSGGSRRFLLIAAVLAGLVILGTGAFLALALRDTPRGVAGMALASAIGGPFQLVDQNGKTVTDADLKGKWSLIYFGYTHCPDACPTALNDISIALSELGPKRVMRFDRFSSRSTPSGQARIPQSLRHELRCPDPGADRDRRADRPGSKRLSGLLRQASGGRGDYSMDHSSVIYVMDPEAGSPLSPTRVPRSRFPRG